ncbi:zinc finger CCCH domain-containing protein 13-like isoform X1 [Quillaja saponaria]|uniref:Zinc finger CCCH domain-containing protein 13-like isoform X1 n=1 Tax=Quillaja saponaria TaxID=32244 RepID=A0AAD7LVZ4_QUISA|nr:zinc finger CCCH domain-containing protein 13-like isoform X1 [Quillaja saponaria]
MPRSSKHKSSKHSSRDTREYSDSEKDSGLKDRKLKEENVAKASKDLSSSEKRKLDLKDVKDLYGSVNGEYVEEYGSSKRRKERVSNGVGDRWNAGEDDRVDGLKKADVLGDSKSKRRDESAGVYGEGDDVKKSSVKGEGKHRDSRRKEGKEGGAEKDRKLKEGRSERLIDNEEQRVSKHVVENTGTENMMPPIIAFSAYTSTALDELQRPELDSLLERRTKKKRDDWGDGEKNQDDVPINDRRLSFGDDIGNDGKQKDEKRKDDKYKEKCREEMDRDSKHQHDKQRDERSAKDHASSRSDEKHSREEKDIVELRQKRSKPRDSDRDRDKDHHHDREGDKDRDVETSRVRERYRERDRDRDCDRLHDRSRDRDYDHDRDHDYDRDWDWDRERDHDRDHGRERDRRRDHDGSHIDDRSSRYKDSGGKKSPLDDRDDYNDTKSRVVKAHYSNMEKKTVSSGRAESDVDRGRSQSRQSHVDAALTSNKRTCSPISKSHLGKDEYRSLNFEDMKYRDSIMEQRGKGLRETTGFSGLSERVPKYKSMDRSIKVDDAPSGEMSTERSSTSKASPMGLVERSPSSTSIDRRYMNRSGVRRSLDIEEAGRRGSIDGRDFSTPEDRLNRELPLEKQLSDESSQLDSSFYGRTSQGNVSLIPPTPAFRAGLDRPFMGSLEDDVRDNSHSRYRRNTDPGFGRGHGSSWRGMPNWSSSVHNAFVPFQHGPTYGGFQATMPHFPSPPQYGVRPPMEVNHSGIPYHIPDSDRFSGHLRPLNWPNMMDGTAPGLHGWGGNNGVLRDDSHIYGGSDWDRVRHSASSRGWESNAETWKDQNGDVKKELPSPSQNDDFLIQDQVDDVSSGQAVQMSNDEVKREGIHEKAVEIKSPPLTSSAEETLNSSHTPTCENMTDISTSTDDVSRLSRFYLSKLDISDELAHLELYDECMHLINNGKSASADEDATLNVYPEDGSRAGLKHSANLSRHSFFPAIDNSIFQRAIDLYKKQRAEICGTAFVTGGQLDIISSSNQVKEEELISVCGWRNIKEPALMTPNAVKEPAIMTSNAETVNTPVSMLDQKKLEAVSPTAKEEMEVDIGQGKEGQDHVQASSHETSGEPLPVMGEEKEKVISEQISGNADETSPELNNESQMAFTSPLSGYDMSTKAKDNNVAYCGDGRLTFGNTVNGSSLDFKDGSLKVCEVLMPDSNESESLILSRIHHSPESTR